MRPAFLFLPPLLVLPLACTDTPAEPETEETTAVFKKQQPKEPGVYVMATISCYESLDAASYVNTEPETIYLVCSDSGPRVAHASVGPSEWVYLHIFQAIWSPGSEPCEPSVYSDLFYDVGVLPKLFACYRDNRIVASLRLDRLEVE